MKRLLHFVIIIIKTATACNLCGCIGCGIGKPDAILSFPSSELHGRRINKERAMPRSCEELAKLLMQNSFLFAVDYCENQLWVHAIGPCGCYDDQRQLSANMFNSVEAPNIIKATAGNETMSPNTTKVLSEVPSLFPSIVPSALPSTILSEWRSKAPSRSPSEWPSGAHSGSPSAWPSGGPSGSPSAWPSGGPSGPPSAWPSRGPSESPSAWPSGGPSESPSAWPSEAPSKFPSMFPSEIPSPFPSYIPSVLPSGEPSEGPTPLPSWTPSDAPSLRPSAPPSMLPSTKPSPAPSTQPSPTPTLPGEIVLVRVRNIRMDLIGVGSLGVSDRDAWMATTKDFYESTIGRGSYGGGRRLQAEENLIVDFTTALRLEQESLAFFGRNALFYSQVLSYRQLSNDVPRPRELIAEPFRNETWKHFYADALRNSSEAFAQLKDDDVVPPVFETSSARLVVSDTVEDDGLSPGGIAGIIIGGIVFNAICFALFLRWRHKRRTSPVEPTEDEKRVHEMEGGLVKLEEEVERLTKSLEELNHDLEEQTATLSTGASLFDDDEDNDPSVLNSVYYVPSPFVDKTRGSNTLRDAPEGDDAFAVNVEPTVEATRLVDPLPMIEVAKDMSASEKDAPTPSLASTHGVVVARKIPTKPKKQAPNSAKTKMVNKLDPIFEEVTIDEDTEDNTNIDESEIARNDEVLRETPTLGLQVEIKRLSPSPETMLIPVLTEEVDLPDEDIDKETHALSVLGERERLSSNPEMIPETVKSSNVSLPYTPSDSEIALEGSESKPVDFCHDGDHDNVFNMSNSARSLNNSGDEPAPVFVGDFRTISEQSDFSDSDASPYDEDLGNASGSTREFDEHGHLGDRLDGAAAATNTPQMPKEEEELDDEGLAKDVEISRGGLSESDFWADEDLDAPIVMPGAAGHGGAALGEKREEDTSMVTNFRSSFTRWMKRK